MIPKIIHYCWISESKNYSLPESVKDCINTWKKFLPDYEIREWNINNIDINENTYMREAYNAKKYAFVSDYIRLYVLYNYGGIYMDTDVKVLKSFDDLLGNKAFMGFESLDRIATCIIGAESKNYIIKEMLDLYNKRSFVKEDGNLDLTPNTVLIQPIIKKYDIKYNNNLQKKDSITIYPIEYFCPLDYATGILKITANSYAIHLFNGTWQEKEQKEYIDLYRLYYNKYSKIYPMFLTKILTKFVVNYKINPFNVFIKKILNKIYFFRK